MGSARPSVFAFQCVLVPYGPFAEAPAQPVVRTIAVREDQTLEELHEAIRIAFVWADPHMYAFWMTGTWWDQNGPRYQTPFELDPDDERVKSGRTALSALELRKGKTIAYLFDFGDEWRLLLKVVDRWKASDESYPIDATGTPPPPYSSLEEDDVPET